MERHIMNQYHKIQTVYKRDSAKNIKTLLIGEYSEPVFHYLTNNEWVFTEKIDGMNIRVIYDGINIIFRGKTDNAQIPNQLVNKLNDMFLSKLDLFKDIFHLEVSFGETICLYGEGYGVGIQKGGKYRQNQSFILFDVKIGKWWIERHNVENIASKLSIDIVPIIGRGTLTDMISMAEKGFKSQWGDFTAEGIVARPAIELKFRNGHRIITKIKHKDFIK